MTCGACFPPKLGHEPDHVLVLVAPSATYYKIEVTRHTAYDLGIVRSPHTCSASDLQRRLWLFRMSLASSENTKRTGHERAGKSNRRKHPIRVAGKRQRRRQEQIWLSCARREGKRQEHHIQFKYFKILRAEVIC